MTIFPMIMDPVGTENAELPMYYDVAWNFADDTPVFRDGSPVVVSGKDAVSVWAWNALHTARYRYEIFTWGYGSEIESLIGGQYTDAVKRSEVARYVTECLTASPYISGVQDIDVQFEDGALKIRCTINTIYGDGQIGGEMHV